jgi:hypothetical protein
LDLPVEAELARPSTVDLQIQVVADRPPLPGQSHSQTKEHSMRTDHPRLSMGVTIACLLVAPLSSRALAVHTADPAIAFVTSYTVGHGKNATTYGGMRVHVNKVLTMALAGALPLTLAVSPTQADWTVVSLHPAGAPGPSSHARAVDGVQQVGDVQVGGSPSAQISHASLWSGTAASWVDLHPAGASSSGASAIYGGQQGGSVFFGGAAHASLWSGTAASWVDLNPPGSVYSGIQSMHGGQQGGFAQFVWTESRAALWTGTAASWVDIHPAAATWSLVYGQDAVQQVGAAGVGGVSHPSLWQGSAASWVDLYPAGANGWSAAFAVADGQQGGYAYFGGIPHAGLWTGSAASWVDLHPPGATSSQVGGIHGGLQVGYAIVGGIQRACLWSGTAASLVDLHAFVPQSYGGSIATGIWTDGPTIHVVGMGGNGASIPYNALLWVFEPDADTDGDGLTDDDELAIGTDPNDPDTDDDGLLDGTEVDMAQGTGCPDPLNPDSDGDTLSDGAEVALGISPCDTDSDGDGIPDDIDPLPTDPEGTAGYLEFTLRTLCDFIHATPLCEFDAPNDNAARGRRNAMCNKVMAAANAVADQDFGSATDGLASLLDKLDDEPNPPDWMLAGEPRDDIRAAVVDAIAILFFM